MRHSAPPVEEDSPTVQLAVAAEVGAALATARDVGELLTLARRKLKWILPATHVSLALLNEDGTHFEVVREDGRTTEYPLEEGLVGWTLRHDTALSIADLQDDAHIPHGTGGIALHRGSGALVVIPLRSNGRLLGCLSLGSTQVAAFAGVDRGLIQLVALQVAAALQSILLLAELTGAEAVIAGMALAVEVKDEHTRGHADRVTRYALRLAREARLPARVHDILMHAGPLHDVGMMDVPDHILTKSDTLGTEELALIRRHPEIGDEICRPLRSLQRLCASVRHHHERWDGQGYPDHLVGKETPLEARVLAIADAYDAMTSTRSYRPAMESSQAISVLATNEGPQWDPYLIKVFVDQVIGEDLAEHPDRSPALSA